jgi:exoribonuclease R
MTDSIPSNRHHLQRIARHAMLDRGFLPEFGPSVIAELRGIPGPAVVQDGSVRDLRALLWSSIDNDDSLDLDQLEVADAQDGRRIKLLVAIADVDALVGKASAIDAQAAHNTTSVYTVAQVFPMLPERLSTDLTSLRQGEARPAIVIEIVIESGGAVVASDLYRAKVLNHAKLAYHSVAAWLDGQGPMPPAIAAVPGMADQLRLQDRGAQALRTRRLNSGALTLQTLETRPVFDGDALVDLRPVQQNRAEAIIEDLMVAANGVTARYLEAKGIPAIRRVLPVPTRWGRIVELAAGAGEHLPADPDASALERFLVRIQQADPLRFPDLSLSVIKLLGSGVYAVDVPGHPAEGHFALAVTAYAHSTAPNRRFPDLLTQRLLKSALAGNPPPYTADDLRVLAIHCTEQEDNARKVERQVQKSASALLLERRVGARFDGIVTGASEKGTWVRILTPPAEGKVVRGFEGLDVGDRVTVQLVSTNVDKGFIDFARVSGTGPASAATRSKPVDGSAGQPAATPAGPGKTTPGSGSPRDQDGNLPRTDPPAHRPRRCVRLLQRRHGDHLGVGDGLGAGADLLRSPQAADLIWSLLEGHRRRHQPGHASSAGGDEGLPNC